MPPIMGNLADDGLDDAVRFITDADDFFEVRRLQGRQCGYGVIVMSRAVP